MQALILAAGRGSRLGSKSGETPKCLLEVGRRRLIEHQLETLSEAGVGPTAMVVGYCADEIRQVVGIQAEYIESSRWATTNSLYSFWMARDWVQGPVVVMNCDILLHPNILARVLRAKGDCIAFDSTSGHGAEHMKVRVVDGRLAEMSKELAPPDVSGENVGILKFTESTARALFAKAKELIDNGKETQWLGSAVCELAKEQPIGAVDIAGLPWGEIDFAYDLESCRKKVWPAIQRDRRRNALPWRALQAAAPLFLLALVAYLAVNVWATPQQKTWETVDVEQVERFEIRAGEKVRKWLKLDLGSDSEMQVSGPTRLRLDSRLLLRPNATKDALYLLEVEIDGERVDWFKERGVKSTTWTHPDWDVAKKRRIELDVPEGDHVVRVRLLQSDSTACLLRASKEERELAED